MKMFKEKIFQRSAWFFLTMLALSCTPYNSGRGFSNAMPNEPGKCYVKCQVIVGKYKAANDLFPIYTGDRPDTVNFVTTQVEVEPPSTKWVKKKADRNCLSADPNDCLVWCLVEVPGKTKTIKYLLDTTETQAYKLEPIMSAAKMDVEQVWRETVCQNKIPNDLIEQLQLALIENGAPFLLVSGIFDQETKTALKEYQMAQGLCFGNLTIETLEALDVHYD